MIRRLLILLSVASAMYADALGVSRLGEEYALEGYMRNEVEARLGARSLHRIEGIWRLTRGGADVAIERNADGGGYLMVVVEAPNRMLLPGTVIGEVVAAGNENMYTARMYTRLNGDMLLMPKRFSLRLNEKSGLLEFLKNRSTMRLNLWHFVPFLYRNSVTVLQGNSSAHDGGIRVFPPSDVPVEPIYL